MSYSTEQRISELKRELAKINGRKVESGRVSVSREWNPFGNATSESLFSQGGGGRKKQF